MRKDRLYFFTFLAITLLFILIASVAVEYFIKVSANQFLQTQLESSKREAREIASLIGSQLANGVDKEVVIQNVQASIGNSNTENGFICMFDWSGREVCHPDKTRVGQQVSPNQSFISSINDDVSSEDFYDVLMDKKAVGGIRNYQDGDNASEIIYLSPVPNSDWIIGAHANIGKIYSQIAELRGKFYSIFLIMGFAIVLGSVITARLIGSAYEKRLEMKNQQLESEVFNLAKLNTDLSTYQQRVSDQNSVEPKEVFGDKGKTRILTYTRNELLPVATTEIAYIFTESTVTYVVDIHGKQSTSNNSLDDLYSSLDEHYFFRANRQVIVAISAIRKIIKYGNNQLKILIQPDSDFDIIISKNRAAEFKSWLNS